jgi:hypothetical protein
LSLYALIYFAETVHMAAEGMQAEGLNLAGIDLEDTDLEGTDLEGADIEGTGVEGTDLEGTDLEGTDLEDTGVEGTDLQSIDLEDIDLEGMDRFQNSVWSEKGVLQYLPRRFRQGGFVAWYLECREKGFVYCLMDMCRHSSQVARRLPPLATPLVALRLDSSIGSQSARLWHLQSAPVRSQIPNYLPVVRSMKTMRSADF